MASPFGAALALLQAEHAAASPAPAGHTEAVIAPTAPGAAAPAPAAEHAAASPAPAGHTEAVMAPTAPGAAAPAPAAEHGAGAHGGPIDSGGILMHHVLDQQPWRPIDSMPGLALPSKHMSLFVIAALIVIAMTRLAIRSYKAGVPSGLGAAVEGLVLFVRDEIAEKNIGHEGRKYTPLLLSLFFFILIAALIGLIPFSATATGNISVTLGLAIVAFIAMQWAGIAEHGVVGHFSHLVPPGMPLWLLPIMIPIEIIAMFSRPFALMIRLFANMLAGHMVITALLLLIPLMATVATAFGIAMIPISLGLSLFILILELLVAFIQAYIFTLLTSIFIGMSVHPAH